MRGNFRVEEVMSSPVVTVTPETSVYEAAKLMAEKRLGSLVVVSHSSPVGVVTERDIVKKAVAEGLRPSEVSVEEVMTKEVISVTPGHSVEEAVKIMRESGIRRLPVVEDGELKGMVSQKDIVREVPDMIPPLQLPGVGEEIYEDPGGEELMEESAGHCEVCGTFSYSLEDYEGRRVCRYCRG